LANLFNLQNVINIEKLFTDGHIHSLNMGDEASTLPGYIHKIVDLEEADKETMHLLVFLLMQFLSRQDQVDQLIVIQKKYFQSYIFNIKYLKIAIHFLDLTCPNL